MQTQEKQKKEDNKKQKQEQAKVKRIEATKKKEEMRKKREAKTVLKEISTNQAKTSKKRKTVEPETSTDSDELSLADSSDSENSGNNSSEENTDERLHMKDTWNINDYVIVEYEGEFYPGVVKAKILDQIEVSSMSMSGPNAWKWPEKEDRIWYHNAMVKEKIAAPSITASRGCGVYSIPEILKYRFLLKKSSIIKHQTVIFYLI